MVKSQPHPPMLPRPPPDPPPGLTPRVLHEIFSLLAPPEPPYPPDLSIASSSISSPSEIPQLLDRDSPYSDSSSAPGVRFGSLGSSIDLPLTVKFVLSTKSSPLSKPPRYFASHVSLWLKPSHSSILLHSSASTGLVSGTLWSFFKLIESGLSIGYYFLSLKFQFVQLPQHEEFEISSILHCPVLRLTCLMNILPQLEPYLLVGFSYLLCMRLLLPLYEDVTCLLSFSMKLILPLNEDVKLSYSSLAPQYEDVSRTFVLLVLLSISAGFSSAMIGLDSSKNTIGLLAICLCIWWWRFSPSRLSSQLSVSTSWWVITSMCVAETSVALYALAAATLPGSKSSNLVSGFQSFFSCFSTNGIFSGLIELYALIIFVYVFRLIFVVAVVVPTLVYLWFLSNNFSVDGEK